MDTIADFAPRFVLLVLGIAAGVGLTDLLKPARPSLSRTDDNPR